MSKEIELLEKQIAFWKSQTTCLIKALDDAEQKAKQYAELLDKTEEELNDERVKNEGHRKQIEGEWIDQYNGKYANPIYVCSLCGKGTLLTPYINELNNMEMTQALSPYCPNCGAKMKGGAV